MQSKPELSLYSPKVYCKVQCLHLYTKVQLLQRDYERGASMSCQQCKAMCI